MEFFYVTENIILRALRKTDAIEIFNAIDSHREYLGKWLPFVDFTKEIDDTQNFVNEVLDTPPWVFQPVFTIRKNDLLIGLIGFNKTDMLNKKTEIGYWLLEEYQKQGVVTKAVMLLCDLAFKNEEINRIQIKCALGNTPSRNIPIRLNFVFEGIERQGELLSSGVFADLEIYSLLKNEVLKSRNNSKDV